MKKVMDYINDSFAVIPDSGRAYKYKQMLIDKVTERANEITHAGITDENVIEDLIISEHSDIKSEFEESEREYNHKKKIKQSIIMNIIGSCVYFLLVISLFLLVSFISGMWNRTWLIIVNGVSLYIAYLCIYFIVNLQSKPLLIREFTRILLYLCIFALALPVFTTLQVLFSVPASWVVFIFAVMAGFIADGIYVSKIGDRFASIFQILYITPFFTMIYIVLSGLRIIEWHPGWIIIPLSLVFVLMAIYIRLRIYYKNKESEYFEEDDEWNREN